MLGITNIVYSLILSTMIYTNDTLWFNRPNDPYIRPQDLVELSNGLFERSLAMSHYVDTNGIQNVTNNFYDIKPTSNSFNGLTFTYNSTNQIPYKKVYSSNPQSVQSNNISMYHYEPELPYTHSYIKLNNYSERFIYNYFNTITLNGFDGDYTEFNGTYNLVADYAGWYYEHENGDRYLEWTDDTTSLINYNTFNQLAKELPIQVTNIPFYDGWLLETQFNWTVSFGSIATNWIDIVNTTNKLNILDRPTYNILPYYGWLITGISDKILRKSQEFIFGSQFVVFTGDQDGFFMGQLLAIPPVALPTYREIGSYPYNGGRYYIADYNWNLTEFTNKYALHYTVSDINTLGITNSYVNLASNSPVPFFYFDNYYFTNFPFNLQDGVAAKRTTTSVTKHQLQQCYDMIKKLEVNLVAGQDLWGANKYPAWCGYSNNYVTATGFSTNSLAEAIANAISGATNFSTQNGDSGPYAWSKCYFTTSSFPPYVRYYTELRILNKDLVYSLFDKIDANFKVFERSNTNRFGTFTTVEYDAHGTSLKQNKYVQMSSGINPKVTGLSTNILPRVTPNDLNWGTPTIVDRPVYKSFACDDKVLMVKWQFEHCVQ
jgi:hypothetical protein